MGVMAMQDRCDAPQVHPSEIRIGDTIGTMDDEHLPFLVKLISEPQRSPQRWTFFGSDERGLQHVSTCGEDQLVHRYGKAS